MALSGSNEGSGSTTYSPKCTLKRVNEIYMSNGEKEMVTCPVLWWTRREFHERLPIAGNSSHATGPGGRIVRATGAPPGCKSCSSRGT